MVHRLWCQDAYPLGFLRRVFSVSASSSVSAGTYVRDDDGDGDGSVELVSPPPTGCGDLPTAVSAPSSAPPAPPPPAHVPASSAYPKHRMHSLRKFHATATSGLISRSLPTTAMLSAVCTRSRRRRTTSAWSARKALTRGKAASRRDAASSGVCRFRPCIVPLDATRARAPCVGVWISTSHRCHLGGKT